MSKKAQATFKKQAGVMDAVHMGLDVAGMVPLFGEVADGINAGLYAARGQWGNAAISAAAMIPVAGQAAVIGKWGAKAAKKGKVFAHGTEAARKVGKGVDASRLGRTKKTVNYGSGKFVADSQGMPLVRSRLKNTPGVSPGMQPYYNLARAPIQNTKGYFGQKSLGFLEKGTRKKFIKKYDDIAEGFQPKNWRKHQGNTIFSKPSNPNAVWHKNNRTDMKMWGGKVLRAGQTFGRGLKFDRVIMDKLLWNRMLPDDKAAQNASRAQKYQNVANNLYDQY